MPEKPRSVETNKILHVQAAIMRFIHNDIIKSNRAYTGGVYYFRAQKSMEATNDVSFSTLQGDVRSHSNSGMILMTMANIR